jgi:hypothetical protein
MALSYNTDDTDRKVLEVIVRLPGKELDDIAHECPDLTWNQVFITIDRLSRAGAVKLTPKGRGLYAVHPLAKVQQQARHHPKV